VGFVDVSAVRHTLPDGRVLLDEVSFRVGDGVRAALVGENGAGKTTLLRIIGGDLEPEAGGVARSGGLGVMRQFIGSVRDGTEVRDLLLDLSPPAVRDAGRALAALELTFQAVYTSPKVRARDTALLACEALGEEPIVTPVLAEDFDLSDARDLLLGVEPDGRILVVGHNPDFAQVVHDLTGARVDFKKGGVAGVRLEGTRGELVALLRPRELDRIGV